jgi:hypothetical protein
METQITAAHVADNRPARPPKGLRHKLERMLAGVLAMPDGSSIPRVGGTVPKAEMVARLTAGVAHFEAIDAQLVALKLARAQMLDAANELQEMHTQWKASLAVSLGRKSPALAQFGLKPQVERRALTSEEQVVRAEKARQTRKLRHTGGRRQKAALKFQGGVDVVAALRPTPAASSDLVDPPPNLPHASRGGGITASPPQPSGGGITASPPPPSGGGQGGGSTST